ncbi:hypothetical protein BKA70DRAFT_1460707 [Coprinopsis sp. MPI-PUGE-AT-0042]|nr:hypothetical protein BKA70DRAFT_1460707 [Coprinopsis sp. MPI-PUGE-AT-0042]
MVFQTLEQTPDTLRVTEVPLHLLVFCSITFQLEIRIPLCHSITTRITTWRIYHWGISGWKWTGRGEQRIDAGFAVRCIIQTDSRSLLKKEASDPGSGSPSLRGRESGGGKLPLLSNGLAHVGPKDPPSSNSQAQSAPTMAVSLQATTDLSTFRSPPSTSPPQPTTAISPQHSSPPISPPSTATSATTSSTQPPSEILNLQRHFQLVEEGWKRESVVPSSRPSPTAEGDADLSSQSLDLLDAQIHPLRITKKSFTFPSSPFLPPPDSQELLSSLSPLPSPRIQLDAKRGGGSSETPPPVVSQEKSVSISPPDALAQTLVIPAVSTPDLSQLNTLFSMYSEGSWGDRFDVASDAEGTVRISLSLLQNLADGEDTGDEDGSEYSGSGGVASNRASNARSSHIGTASTVGSPGLGGRFSATTRGSPTAVGSPGYRAASGGGTSAIGSLTRQDSTASTMTKTKRSQYPAQERSRCLQRTSSPSPHPAPLLQVQIPSSSNFPRPRTNSPIPLVPSLNSQSYSSLLSQKSQGTLSPATHIFPAPKSPTSPTLSSNLPHVFSSPSSQSSTCPPCEHRPSNAPSLSPALAAYTASWEGDIYDDYRYSRYSDFFVWWKSRTKRQEALQLHVSSSRRSYLDSPRGSMDRERVRVDSGDSINSQKLVHPLSIFHSKQDSDASVYTQGSRTSVQLQTGFSRRSRSEGVEEIPKDSARSSPVAAAGSLRSSPSLPASSLHSSPSLQASSLRSSPSIGATTLRSRSDSNATTLEGGAGTRSRSNSTHRRPPPLALTNSNIACADSKSNTVSASSNAPTTSTTTTTASSTNRDSSASTSSNNSTTGSPLLHATWGSPLSSPSSSMGAGTTAGLGSAVGAGGFGFVAPPTGSSFRGAALAMRQMIEESQKSPTAVPGGYSLMHHATKIPEGERTRSLDMSVDSSFAKGANEEGNRDG